MLSYIIVVVSCSKKDETNNSRDISKCKLISTEINNVYQPDKKIIKREISYNYDGSVNSINSYFLGDTIPFSSFNYSYGSDGTVLYTVKYEYVKRIYRLDANKRAISATISSYDSSQLIHWIEYIYSYDVTGRLTKANVTDSSNGSITRYFKIYNWEDGNLTSIIDSLPDGNKFVVSYTYYPGRVNAFDYSNQRIYFTGLGSKNLVKSITDRNVKYFFSYKFNPDGLPIEMTTSTEYGIEAINKYNFSCT